MIDEQSHSASLYHVLTKTELRRPAEANYKARTQVLSDWTIFLLLEQKAEEEGTDCFILQGVFIQRLILTV